MRVPTAITYYRRMMPKLLAALEFRFNNGTHRPLLDALDAIRRAEGEGRQFFKADEVAIEGVIRPKWRDIVLEDAPGGGQRVNRINYEICVLQTLRERLRCKEVWVVGAGRFRNPDADLPADFAERRAECYQRLGLPMEARAFTDALRAEMTEALGQLNRGMPRTPGPIAIQVEYSLVARDVEGEHIPAAREAGMGVMPWSPLAGGFLTGKYRREDTSGSGWLSGANPFGNSKFTDRNWDVLEVLKSVTAEVGRPAAQVALAWIMARPGVATTLIDASKLEQLASNVAASEITLNEDQMTRLNEVSAPAPGFSMGLASPMVRRMVFGGNDVTGWPG